MGLIPKPHLMLMTSAKLLRRNCQLFYFCDLEVCMLTSIAMISLLGLLLGWIFSKLKLPSLLGWLLWELY